jgi:hypothetical protein
MTTGAFIIEQYIFVIWVIFCVLLLLSVTSTGNSLLQNQYIGNPLCFENFDQCHKTFYARNLRKFVAS